MKRGTGDDPFAETGDEPVETSDEAVEGVSVDRAAARVSEGSVRPPADLVSSGVSLESTDELPYLPRRQLKGDSVKADRDQVLFFLRDRVQQGERDFRKSVEDEIGKEINKTDLREAAYVFAQRNPDGVADVLREWGIHYLD